MSFKYDIYISFAEKDNQVTAGEQNAWVSTFQKFMETLLSQLMGTKPSVITSADVTGVDFNPINDCCVVLYIVSPDYLESYESRRDLLFLNDMGQSEKSKLNMGTYSRLFKIVKSYVPIENHPAAIRSLNSYDLFYYDTFTGAMKEFSAFFGEEAEKSYWTRLVDLSYDIYKVLGYSYNKAPRTSVEDKEQNVIYLASTGKELSINRDLIRIDLEHHGYKVLPEESFVFEDVDVKEKIKEKISNSNFFIQLIGESFVNDKENQLMQLENALISEVVTAPNENQKGRVNRLVWVPSEMKFQNEQDKNKFEVFRSGSQSLQGADVLQVPLEDFKTILRQKLLNKRSEETTLYEDGKSLYFVVDKMDYDSAQPLINFFKEEKIQVLLPLYEGELMEVRSRHQANLNECDAVVLYYDKVSEQWLKSKVLDVLKSPGFGRKKIFTDKVVLMKEGAELAENYYLSNKFTLLKNTPNIKHELVQSVVKKIKEIQ